jgi:predicted nucleic acid-binding protein
MHGGAAPQVKEAADRVLLEQLIAPALIRLKELVENPETSDAVALAAIKEVLGRTLYSEDRHLTAQDIEREIQLREAEKAGWMISPDRRQQPT